MNLALRRVAKESGGLLLRNKQEGPSSFLVSNHIHVLIAQGGTSLQDIIRYLLRRKLKMNEWDKAWEKSYGPSWRLWHFIFWCIIGVGLVYILGNLTS